ncbi:gephyrin-like molybdotransferase Glp [Sporomusa acidovorans]|uniref:Molybdopterin molybdenumtransferase n=1 Tax=Sporomusa acidovorans (strain ATCC 49682 / DSM 3132 / Mol) TaxID=1123286 RepID=A0ABZ3J1F2_SPOA4|nr:gephyrin-like molybdotransferase Glp [Sporomusa acidovorans]OZC22459.1 molybdopterin molybdenumtransferase [Sporomusa acidovorans DSM 3132]SDE74383.1 molybdopterin molybdotransferase [Sporomusa acidovorans]
MSVQLETAQKILLDLVSVMPKEQVVLQDCWRRILAETVIADMDFPPFDRSPLDGYAIIAEEVAGATPANPVTLRQIDYVPAGENPSKPISTGTACRIMTGAPLPPGATGVIRLEDTVSQEERVSILSGGGAEKNICLQGEEISQGEEVVAQGTIINTGVMGMLAALGKSRPYVFRKPRVALIATGSEILGIDCPLVPGKIRNSNSYMLSAQVAEAGAQAVLLGNVADNIDEISRFLETAADCDVFITTGGASVGDYDLIGEVYKKMGITLLFDRVSMKPGMPVLAGIRAGKLYIGLSGNPAAAAISFEQLVRPALMKMGGRKVWWRPQIRAVLASPFMKKTGAKRFVWARCWQTDANILVEPLHRQGNGMLKAAIRANALIVVPENSPPLSAGTEVEVILLADA